MRGRGSPDTGSSSLCVRDGWRCSNSTWWALSNLLVKLLSEQGGVKISAGSFQALSDFRIKSPKKFKSLKARGLLGGRFHHDRRHLGTG